MGCGGEVFGDLLKLYIVPFCMYLDRLSCCGRQMDGCSSSKTQASFVYKWWTYHFCAGIQVNVVSLFSATVFVNSLVQPRYIHVVKMGTGDNTRHQTD